MTWTCTQPVETCPCICCQFERQKRVLEATAEAGRRATAERDAAIFHRDDYETMVAEGQIARRQLQKERDEARALLAEAWEWTRRGTPGKRGDVDLERRVEACLKEGQR